MGNWLLFGKTYRLDSVSLTFIPNNTGAGAQSSLVHAIATAGETIPTVPVYTRGVFKTEVNEDFDSNGSYETKDRLSPVANVVYTLALLANSRAEWFRAASGVPCWC